MSRPQEPSESLVVGVFDGIRNTVAPERLGVRDLEVARNVDVDDAGQVRRRRGFEQVLAGDFHSLHTTPDGRSFCVRDNQLTFIRPDLSTQTLAFVGASPLAYLSIGETVYFTSAAVSGKIAPDLTILPWGQEGGDGLWLSPVARPTETLGAVAGQLLRAPPLAEWMTLHNGRIYLAEGAVLWATEMHLFDYVDATRTFFQYEAPITGLQACGEGFYVGTTEAVYFCSGPLRELRRQLVVNAPCVPGSMINVASDHVRAAGDPALQYRDAILFTTPDGVIAGFEGGFCRNLTKDRVMLPPAQRSAAFARMQDGMHHYVAVMQGPPGTVSAAAVGDHIDVEIIRAPRRSPGA